MIATAFEHMVRDEGYEYDFSDKSKNIIYNEKEHIRIRFDENDVYIAFPCGEYRTGQLMQCSFKDGLLELVDGLKNTLIKYYNWEK